MDSKQEFLRKLIETFKQEAEEGLKKISACLIKLEKATLLDERKALVESVYRESHSLKGASRAVNLLDIESICQSFENVMSAIKAEKITLNTVTFDTLNDTVDLISNIIIALNDGLNHDLKNKIKGLIKNLSEIEAGNASNITISTSTNIVQKKENKKETKKNYSNTNEQKQTSQILKNKTYVNKNNIDVKSDIDVDKLSNETIRISTKKLDNLLFQGEEMLSIKQSAAQQLANSYKIVNDLEIWSKEYTNVSTSIQNIKKQIENKASHKLLVKEEKEINKIIQFFDWSNSHHKELTNILLNNRKFSIQQAYESESKIDALVDNVKELITVPFSMVIDTLPKAIRDISRDLGKKVDLEIIGENIEVDRRILEALRQPLMHIIRNCLDYGIETPDNRIIANKMPIGKIIIQLERLENNKLRLEISDDGAGINFEKLKNLYIKNENISDSEIDKITEKDLLYYIFKSGISTNAIITDLSGRGLGLAIVQEKIDQLGGSITVSSVKNEGATFNIELPLTLITFKGIVFKIGESEFVIPTGKVLKVMRVSLNDIKTIEKKNTMVFEGHIIPLVNMGNVLALDGVDKEVDYLQVLIIGRNTERIAFAVDEIIEEQEILVKKFNKHLVRIKNISGATVLGSGKVVPILNSYDLIKSANESTTHNKKQLNDSSKGSNAKSVLVVEDSITSRTLLKNILESAGYLVTTAIDGIDGITKLKTQLFNAVVSDIEMPRMNGFELTQEIRNTKTLAELPLILVSSLSKKEDQERGIEVGADAYIIKSSFDQSNLLEILERLI